MKTIVIIGAGFAGLACAKRLQKLFSTQQVKIILIDKNTYHNVHGNLYEVASSPAELTDLRELRKTVAIPLKEIFSDGKVSVVCSEVVSINLKEQKVDTIDQAFTYDYLVVSMGAEVNFYNIPGADKYALPLQNPKDALLVRNQIEQIVAVEAKLTKKPVLNIVVAGGGVSGVELASELQGMIRFLSWQNSIPSGRIKTVVVEMAPTILPGFDQKVVSMAEQRLHDLNVELKTSTAISEVTDRLVNFADSSSLKYDALIWTAGVKSCSKGVPKVFKTERGDRVSVNEKFQVEGFDNVFVIGDQCCHHMPDGNPLPGTASQAINQGEYVAQAVQNLFVNKQPLDHRCRTMPMIITVGGKWAIFHSGRFTVGGRLGYIIRKVVWFRYFSSILGWARGLHWLLRARELYERND